MKMVNRTRPPESNDGGRICERMRQTREQVGGCWARRGRADTGFASQACIGIGHHRSSLLVAYIDHAETELATGILGAQHRTTHNEKHRVDAFVVQCPCDQFVTKYFGHIPLLSQYSKIQIPRWTLSPRPPFSLSRWLYGL